MRPPRFAIEHIPRTELTTKRFRFFFEQRRPLLIENFLEPSRSEEWSARALDELFGEVAVEAKRFAFVQQHNGPRFSSLALGTECMLLRSFLERATSPSTIEQRETLYLRLSAASGALPELFSRAAFPSLFHEDGTGLAPWIIHDTLLRIGQHSYTYPAHCDGMENLFLQLAGTKHFVFFAPSDVERMYPHPEDPSRSSIECIDDVDRTRFPAFAHATAYECEVPAGALLYLPALWFHEVRSRGWSVSMSRYYKRPRHTEYVRSIKPEAWRAYETARGILHY